MTENYCLDSNYYVCNSDGSLLKLSVIAADYSNVIVSNTTDTKSTFFTGTGGGGSTGYIDSYTYYNESSFKKPTSFLNITEYEEPLEENNNIKSKSIW